MTDESKTNEEIEMPGVAPSFSRGRSWGIGFHVGLAVAAVLALVVMVNYLASRHFVRWQWTGVDRQVLSPMTRQVLHSLTNQVRVLVFFDQEESPAIYSAVVGLLEEYQAVSRRIEVQKVDYMRQPDRANLIKEKYKPTLPEVNQATLFRNLVIFDSPGQQPRVVYEKQLSDFDLKGLLSGRTNEVKRVDLKESSFLPPPSSESPTRSRTRRIFCGVTGNMNRPARTSRRATRNSRRSCGRITFRWNRCRCGPARRFRRTANC
jgi:hypothetical protein